MIYPWQTEQWKQLLNAKQKNRLPHALLFTGIEGVGKTHFAEQFIRTFCCKNNNMEDCACHDCRLIAGKAHPNILWIEPEKVGSAIKVDQIREVSEYVQQTSLQHEFRIVLIYSAHEMNASAANALLKTLEEPSSGTIIILISNQAGYLPATILSRCQRILFPRPSKELALTWLRQQNTGNADVLLRIANGAPLTALQFANNKMLSERANLLETLFLLSQKQTDPLKTTMKIQELDSLPFLDFMLTWVMDLLRLHLECDHSHLVNQDFLKQLSVIQQRSKLQPMMQYLNYLNEMRTQISTGFNLNKQLMIENVLIRWMECATCF